jgi:2-alkyl-3-oxoalkanoate reductase
LLRERPGHSDGTSYLIPALVAAGHRVTATTRTPGKVAQLREAGAEPVVVDGLDLEAVIAAVRAVRRR